ncbi:MAG: hypothetical protein E7011_03285 [Alphaproteobacteria bacterium]|nr:hypothetical protein [Alphaproteobacteria bacterium]
MRALFYSAIFSILCTPCFADVLPLDDALRSTYRACVGIDDQLNDLRRMAGINTAITAAGTAAGAGATVVGIVKTSKDKKAESLEAILNEIKEMTQNSAPMTTDEIDRFMFEFNAYYETALKSTDSIQSELDKTVAQSKKLGNWRTGLLAGGTATNIAGAVIASSNKVDGDIFVQIELCKTSVANLRNSIIQARLNGQDITEAEEIIRLCGEYDYADLSKINTKARGATISSAIGATTGAVGTVLSASANSQKVRDDNTDTGKHREKNLNTASNIMAGATTAASATATIFNATQIGAIRRVSDIAEKCTEVLK